MLHIVYTTCPSCDAWMLESTNSQEEMYFPMPGCLPSILNNSPSIAGDSARAASLSGSQEARSRLGHLILRGSACRFLGGEPRWLQSETWAVCPQCDG